MQEHAGAMPPATDDVARLLAAASVTLTAEQTAFVGRLKAFHDDGGRVRDPERPTPQLKAQETPMTLVAQATELRQQLLKTLLEAAA